VQKSTFGNVRLMRNSLNSEDSRTNVVSQRLHWMPSRCTCKQALTDRLNCNWNDKFEIMLVALKSFYFKAIENTRTLKDQRNNTNRAVRDVNRARTRKSICAINSSTTSVLIIFLLYITEQWDEIRENTWRDGTRYRPGECGNAHLKCQLCTSHI